MATIRRRGKGKAARVRERLFPDAKTFNTNSAGFVPLPIVLRAVQWMFRSTEWVILTNILMRCGPEQVCWFTLQELAYDLNYRSVTKLRPYLAALEDKGFLISHEERGIRYYCPVDARVAIQKLADSDRIPGDRLDSINDLFELLNQDEIAPSSSNVVPAIEHPQRDGTDAN